MMTCFFKIDSMWQIFLLILSQLTVFSYVISVVFLYRRGCKPSKLASVVVAFVINTILYATLQLDSRITEGSLGIHLHSPYIILFIVVLSSLFYSVLSSTARWQNTAS